MGYNIIVEYILLKKEESPMSLDNVVNTIYHSFQEHAASARVILLHFAGRYRTALVSRLLADPDVRVFYYAMGSDDMDIPWSF